MILEKVADHEDARLLTRQGQELLPIFNTQCQWFFDEHIFSRKQRLFCKSEVLGRGRSYNHCMNVRHGKNFFETTRSENVIRTAQFGKPRRICITDCTQASDLRKNPN